MTEVTSWPSDELADDEVSCTDRAYLAQWLPFLHIGGSRGRARRTRPLPKGPDSFVLTYKIFET